jgi:hypothetical protein
MTNESRESMTSASSSAMSGVAEPDALSSSSVNPEARGIRIEIAVPFDESGGITA